MLIPIYNRKSQFQIYAIVDDEDDYLLNYQWILRNGYAATKIFGTNSYIRMHRLILGLDDVEGGAIDHINNDKLDNRQSNLRFCSQKENTWNSRKKKNGVTSKYKGVHYSWERKKWVASIGYERRVLALGRFDSEEEAALVYNKKAIELFGAYAKLNEVI